MGHRSRPPSSSGSRSSSCDSSPGRLAPRRPRTNARTGCSRVDARSSRSMVSPIGGASGVATNGGVADRLPRPATAAARSRTSKLNASGRPSAPVTKLRSSTVCSGWRTTRARASPCTAASRASSSSPTGTAGGRAAPVRSSAPEYTTTRCSCALVTASRKSWRSSWRAIALTDERVPRQDVVAVATRPAGERAVVHPEQGDHAVRHGAHRGERAHGERPGAEARPGGPTDELRFEQRDDVGQAQRGVARRRPRQARARGRPPPAASGRPAARR